MMFRILIVITVIISSLLGCKEHIIPLDGVQFHEKFNESRKNTASSWWIIKEDDNSYFLMMKVEPFETSYYKIDKKYIYLNIDSKSKYPINLKTKDIVFMK